MKNIKGIVEIEKKKIRDYYKNKRNIVSTYLDSNPLEKDRIITQFYKKLHEIFKLKQIVLEDIVISTYYPIQSEIDTLSLCLTLKQENPKLQIALPEMIPDTRVLKFKEYISEDRLKIGKFKVKEPDDSCKELIPNIVLTPLLSFDSTKNRLGYGMGYYDNTLRSLFSENKSLLSIGVGYDEQFSESLLPEGSFDYKLEFIITPSKIFM